MSTEYRELLLPSINENTQISEESFRELQKAAAAAGIFSASIYPIYKARGEETLAPTFTVPAFNLRGIPYHTACSAFSAAKKSNTGLFIFELARSEMEYTNQRPRDVAAAILAAAIDSNWEGPVFIQGDHFQAKAAAPGVAKEGEVAALENLIDEAIEATFFNIDIDASTLVDLSHNSVSQQQQANFTTASNLAKKIRTKQPNGITISIGGEIGEVGKSLSTEEELIAFMEGFNTLFANPQEKPTGLAKISIQTGTKHGGSVAADGSIQSMNVDFERITALTRVARSRFQLGGVVQHGASTLAKNQFPLFPQAETLEIHLSTGLQNTVLDHKAFPNELTHQINSWLDKNCHSERNPEESDAQFYYRLRKKAWGAFRTQTWNLPADSLAAIMQTQEEEFSFFFDTLAVHDTRKLTAQYYSF